MPYDRAERPGPLDRSNWGSGESVVSGLVSSEHFLVQRPDGDILEERIGAKEVWRVFDPSKAGSSSSRRRRSKPDVRA